MNPVFLAYPASLRFYLCKKGCLCSLRLAVHLVDPSGFSNDSVMRSHVIILKF